MFVHGGVTVLHGEDNEVWLEALWRLYLWDEKHEATLDARWFLLTGQELQGYVTCTLALLYIRDEKDKCT